MPKKVRNVLLPPPLNPTALPGAISDDGEAMTDRLPMVEVSNSDDSVQVNYTFESRYTNNNNNNNNNNNYNTSATQDGDQFRLSAVRRTGTGPRRRQSTRPMGRTNFVFLGDDDNANDNNNNNRSRGGSAGRQRDNSFHNSDSFMKSRVSSSSSGAMNELGALTLTDRDPTDHLFGARLSDRRQSIHIVQEKYADKVHVFSVPAFSYYVPANVYDSGGGGPFDEDDEGESCCSGGSGSSNTLLPPRDELELNIPTMSAGRLIEQERYNLPTTCAPYRIPIYDQASFKYVYGGLFANDFELREVVGLLRWFIFAHINLAMTCINLFANQSTLNLMPWIKDIRFFVFLAEFSIVGSLYVVIWLTIIDAFWKRNIGTKLAHDVAMIVTLMATFSVLRMVGFASPAFAVRRIVPVFLNAVLLKDYMKGIFFFLVWVGACLVAFLSVIAKVTQIDFAFTQSISEWNILEIVQLVGLVSNLARVDDSYYKEASVLLDAIHKHFLPPGSVAEAFVQNTDCLFTRIRRVLRLPPYMYFNYLEVIFNYHMNWQWSAACAKQAASRRQHDASSSRRRERRPPMGQSVTSRYDHTTGLLQPEDPYHDADRERRIPISERVHYSSSTNPIPVSFTLELRRFLIYLSFALSIDTIKLRRYLQMTQSPLPYYRIGRESFTTAFLEKDCVVMDMALWRNDPLSSGTRRYAEKNSGQFNIRYVCEDRRDIWDDKYHTRADKM